MKRLLPIVALVVAVVAPSAIAAGPVHRGWQAGGDD
jgi:hypothetical protein